ncbi:hypothetical protein BGY98DRAFT_1118691 [Russula aff. rugulosa BPL654]|nr:hypothetical protein BGY98DRAFT_1118691 [Russula aff. rugulosa BPL654]
MALLPSNHFLALPRPDVLVGPPVGVVDTTTLAAHDFDVDTRTGFMPPNPPLARLPSQWEPWEQLLDDAQSYRLQLGKKINITEEEKSGSESWRARVAQLPTLPTAELCQSELLLRRSHHVLAWTMHFYIHSLPPEAEIRIPAPITVPLLQICVQLELPPVITYSDDVLYNWALKVPSTEPTPALDNLRCLTLFTGTRDEEEFYLASARIELRGVDALEIMRATMDELFVGDTLAARRITRYLQSLVRVLDDLARLLLAVRDGCDPDVFYHVIRPWFNGADSGSKKWTFEGLDDDTGTALRVPAELSAPFLSRMRAYMPRHHRNFLRHLGAAPRPLRAAVARMGDAALTEAYNAAVDALRRFRDAHLCIVALYIVSPSHRSAYTSATSPTPQIAAPRLLRGTGGTDLIKFLKGVRDRTSEATLPSGAL